jgi:hypothetical protein
MSLLFAIMALVVMSLAAIALLRSVDVAAMIAGNLGFKQDATAASAAVTSEAIAALDQRRLAGLLDADDAAQGYYANSLENLDPTGATTSAANKMLIVDWLGDGACSYAAAGTFINCLQAKLGTPVRGHTVRWIITRLCKSSDAESASNPCTKPMTSSSAVASERGALSAGGRIVGVSSSPYYRIIVRTEGARNTVSFTETILHF